MPLFTRKELQAGKTLKTPEKVGFSILSSLRKKADVTLQPIDDVMTRVWNKNPEVFGDSFSRDNLKPLYLVRDPAKEAVGFVGAKINDDVGEIQVGIDPQHRGKGHGRWAVLQLLEKHPEVKHWKFRPAGKSEQADKFAKNMGFEMSTSQDQTEYSRPGGQPRENSLLHSMAFGESKKANEQVAKYLIGALAGTGLAAGENKYIFGNEVPPEFKKTNLVLGALTGGMTPHPAVGLKTLAAWPMKSTGLVGAGALAKLVKEQRGLTDTNLETAKTNLQSAKDPTRRIAMVLGALGAAGVGAYAFHKMRDDAQKAKLEGARRPGDVKLRLPGAPGKPDAEVEIPFESLPKNLYSGVMRDTRRQLRKEINAATLHRALQQFQQQKQSSVNDVIPGGQAAGRATSQFNSKELELGRLVEKEHSPNPEVQTEIAKDHIAKNKHYYSNPASAAKDIKEDIDKGLKKRGSAYLGDVKLSDLPEDVRKDVERFGQPLDSTGIHYGIVASELVSKADPKNLEDAKAHVAEDIKKGKKKSEDEFYAKRDKKYILIMNDRIIDGHHFLANALAHGCTSSLNVIDLTPSRVLKSREAVKQAMIKSAIIRSVGDDKYVLFSHKGKRLSKPASLGATKKRMAQVEYFKKKGASEKKSKLKTVGEGTGAAASAAGAGRIMASGIGKSVPSHADLAEMMLKENPDILTRLAQQYAGGEELANIAKTSPLRLKAFLLGFDVGGIPAEAQDFLRKTIYSQTASKPGDLMLFGPQDEISGAKGRLMQTATGNPFQHIGAAGKGGFTAYGENAGTTRISPETAKQVPHVVLRPKNSGKISAEGMDKAINSAFGKRYDPVLFNRMAWNEVTAAPWTDKSKPILPEKIVNSLLSNPEVLSQARKNPAVREMAAAARKHKRCPGAVCSSAAAKALKEVDPSFAGKKNLDTMAPRDFMRMAGKDLSVAGLNLPEQLSSRGSLIMSELMKLAPFAARTALAAPLAAGAGYLGHKAMAKKGEKEEDISDERRRNISSMLLSGPISGSAGLVPHIGALGLMHSRMGPKIPWKRARRMGREAGVSLHQSVRSVEVPKILHPLVKSYGYQHLEPGKGVLVEARPVMPGADIPESKMKFKAPAEVTAHEIGHGATLKALNVSGPMAAVYRMAPGTLGSMYTSLATLRAALSKNMTQEKRDKLLNQASVVSLLGEAPTLVDELAASAHGINILRKTKHLSPRARQLALRAAFAKLPLAFSTYAGSAGMLAAAPQVQKWLQHRRIRKDLEKKRQN